MRKFYLVIVMMMCLIVLSGCGADKKDDLKCEDNEEVNKEKISKELVDEIQKRYEEAYDLLYEEFENFDDKKYVDYYDKKIAVIEINEEKIKEYFTSSALETVFDYRNVYIDDVYYFTWDDLCEDDYVCYTEYFDPGTIFSSTDSGIRDLTIKSYSENYVIAQSEDDYDEEFIIFEKVDGVWKIALFE